MAGALGGSGGQFDGDVELAWSYAINADLVRDDTEVSAQRVRELVDTRRRLYTSYLLYDLRCDPDRLAAVARECDARAAADDRPGGYRTAAELADSALTLIREAEAVNGPSGRRLLLEELDADLTGRGTGNGAAAKDPHRRARRIMRRANPIWWFRRVRTRLTVLMACRDYPHGPYRELVMTMGGRQVGHVVFAVCPQCRSGYIAKMSVDADYQGCGVGTRALKCLRREYRGYTWSTSAQYSWSRTFWQMTARRAGGGYQQASLCDHLES